LAGTSHSSAPRLDSDAALVCGVGLRGLLNIGRWGEVVGFTFGIKKPGVCKPLTKLDENVEKLDENVDNSVNCSVDR